LAHRVPDPPEDGTASAVLRGGGEVGADLLAVDWAATSLGPPERWPQSLTTVVSIVLGSRFSMWMAWGPELTFFCNDAYRRDTLGAKHPWALGRPASEVWAEIWPDIGPRIEQVMRTGMATWDEALLLFLERSGYPEETYHTFSYSPLADDDGQIVGMLCVVSEDTERVIAERRLETLRALGAGTTSLRSEAEALAAARVPLEAGGRDLPFSLVYLQDDGGVLRLASSTGVEPGHPVAPLVLDATSPYTTTGAEPTAVALSAREDLPTGGWPGPPTHAAVVPFPPQGGRDRPDGVLVAGLNPFRPFDEGYRTFAELIAGQLSAAIASARTLEAERERAEKLAELDRAKTAFFTNVSHELRTPLTLLLGPSEDALTDTDEPLGPTQRRRVEVIDRNAQRLLKLVNTLLDLSRLESGRTVARYEPVELGDYTAELASMFESAVRRAGLTLEIDCARTPAPAYVDREMWAKVVLNLLSNALKFTFEGAVAVRLHATDGDVVLTVADTGVGIPPEEQPRLFDRFHRVSGAASRSHEGSGIGLALVAELAALHGGRASVQSTPGEGSAFTVALPLGRDHLPADQVADDAAGGDTAGGDQAEAFVAEALRWLDGDADGATALPSAPGGDRARILVADDNADMRRYVADLLTGDHDVLAAPDGAAALELARRDPPDLILTDVMMPNLDGFGLLRALRADPATMTIPVVMLSARAGEDGTVEGLEAGADDYLVKPFAARELQARVRSNLELDRVRRARDQLDRSQALLDQAQRLADVGSWEVDMATGQIDASDHYLRMLGLDAAEFHALGRDEAIARLVHPDDGARLQEALLAGLDGAPIALEIRLRPRGDGERLARVIGEVVRDGSGRPKVLRGSVQDITRQRAAELALATATAEREAAAREHRIADELQRSLLPPRSFDPEHLEVATYYRAGAEGTQVGGDWYDIIELPRGRTALVIGDVMGRGVHAAAVMGQLRAAVRAYAHLDLAPGAILMHLDGVVQDLDADQIVTCVYAIHDPDAGTLTYASAGHLPPVLAPPGAPAVVLGEGGGPPLGSGVTDAPIAEGTVALAPGATLALYTDGLVERRDQDITNDIQRCADALVAAAQDRVDVAALPEHLVATLAPGGPSDDVAILIARVQ
jgi:signal transduction histidine kinase/DNA-binding response OmpR family regulator/serine phosphatase RsbU (regulator of sigma subunit)